KLIPSSVTTPPARASPRGPARNDRSTGSARGSSTAVTGGRGTAGAFSPRRRSSSSSRIAAVSSAVCCSRRARRAVSASIRAGPFSTIRTVRALISDRKGQLDDRYEIVARRRIPDSEDRGSDRLELLERLAAALAPADRAARGRAEDVL